MRDTHVVLLHHRWNEDNSEELLYSQFLKAVELTGQEFKDCVEYVYKAWLPARSIVKVDAGVCLNAL
jgi:hypothetical protein